MREDSKQIYQRSLKQFFTYQITLILLVMLITLLNFGGFASMIVLIIGSLFVWGLFSLRKKNSNTVFQIIRVLLGFATFIIGLSLLISLYGVFFKKELILNHLLSRDVSINQSIDERGLFSLWLSFLSYCWGHLLPLWFLIYNTGKALNHMKQTDKTLEVEASET